MTQAFTPELCAHLSSLAPGFKGHYIYSKLGDEKIIVRCREDMEYWNSDYSIGDDIKIICPAWQVEDVLRNLHKILYCIVPGIEKIKVGQEIARLLFTHGDTAYQKIEEYLWEILGCLKAEECTGTHCKCMQSDCANHHYNDHKK